MRAARGERTSVKALRSMALLALVSAVAAMPAARADVRYRDPIFPVVSIIEDIAYGEAENNLGETQTLMLDLFTPYGDTETGRPAVVLAHGGGFTGGSRKDLTMFGLAADYGRRGYVAMSIGYRVRPPGTPGSPTVPDLIVGSLAGEMPPAMRDAQHDMQAAVRWVRANAASLGVDPKLIVSGGVSAGASMALETAYNPDDPGASGTPAESSAVAAAISISGATDPRRIEAGSPPVVLFHGALDTTAPYPTAAMTCGATIALMNVCELHTYPTAGHSLGGNRPEIIDFSTAFLCRYVLTSCT